MKKFITLPLVFAQFSSHTADKHTGQWLSFKIHISKCTDTEGLGDTQAHSGSTSIDFKTSARLHSY